MKIFLMFEANVKIYFFCASFPNNYYLERFLLICEALVTFFTLNLRFKSFVAKLIKIVKAKFYFTYVNFNLCIRRTGR